MMGKVHSLLSAHTGDIFTARQVLIDIEDSSIVESSAIFVVLVSTTQAPRSST